MRLQTTTYVLYKKAPRRAAAGVSNLGRCTQRTTNTIHCAAVQHANVQRPSGRTYIISFICICPHLPYLLVSTHNQQQLRSKCKSCNNLRHDDSCQALGEGGGGCLCAANQKWPANSVPNLILKPPPNNQYNASGHACCCILQQQQQQQQAHMHEGASQYEMWEHKSVYNSRSQQQYCPSA